MALSTFDGGSLFPLLRGEQLGNLGYFPKFGHKGV